MKSFVRLLKKGKVLQQSRSFSFPSTSSYGILRRYRGSFEKFMIRIYIEERSLKKEEAFTATQDQSHYLLNVMRLKDNDSILVFNEQSGEFSASIRIEKKRLILEPKTILQLPQPPKRPMWLAFSPIKIHMFHFVIQKATELGVTHIQLIMTKHTQNRHFDLEKLRKIAIEASEQSERLDVPRIFPPLSLTEFCTHLPQVQWFAAIERSGSNPLLDVLLKNKDFGIMIGPEAGFSEDEKALLSQHPDVQPVSLGENILRAETAAIYALACFHAHTFSNRII